MPIKRKIYCRQIVRFKTITTAFAHLTDFPMIMMSPSAETVELADISDTFEIGSTMVPGNRWLFVTIHESMPQSGLFPAVATRSGILSHNVMRMG